MPVTGGTRGIERAAVEAFLSSGASVAVNGRTTGFTTRAITELGAGEKLVAAPCDVATASGCRSGSNGTVPHRRGTIEANSNT